MAVDLSVKTPPALFQLSLAGCLTLVLVGLVWGSGRFAARHATHLTVPPASPSARVAATVPVPAPLLEPELLRLGRIRFRFELMEAEPPVASRSELHGAEVRSPSELEAFFARHIDPLFHRTGGWQFYNPDQLDRGQESARTTSLAFAAGLRYRHSF